MSGPPAPRVSVIIPTYNRAGLVLRAVASVLAQTMPDLEVIVVVDGSTDNTTDRLRRVDDPRMRWVEHTNVGVSESRNRGIELASGDWVAFLDDDNEYRPTYLEAQLATAERSGAPVVYARGLELVPDGVARILPQELPYGDVFEALARGWQPFISAVMVRQTLLIEVGGFSPSLAAREDTHLFTRLALVAQFAPTPEALMVRHAHHGPRLGADDDLMMDAYVELDRDLRSLIIQRRGRRAYARWFRSHRGEGEIARMLACLSNEGRATAWATVVRLASCLPWSASSMARPLALLVVGPHGYAKLRSAYHASQHP